MAEQALIVKVADAVVSEINGASITTAQAERRFIPYKRLDLANELRITVVPVGNPEINSETEITTGMDYRIDVGVQKRFEPDKIETQVAALLLIVEKIQRLLQMRTLAAYDDATVVDVVYPAAYSYHHMRELNQFTSVLQLTVRVHVGEERGGS